MTSEAPRLHGPLALQPLHPHWGVPTTRRALAQGRVLVHPLSWSRVRGYVRLNDLSPEEREQHAADKLAKKARDLKDRRAAKKQRTAGPQMASSCADDSSEH